MKKTIFGKIPVFMGITLIAPFMILSSSVFAASGDVMVRDTNLGRCTYYSDGCNEHKIVNGTDTQTTNVQCIWAGVPKCLDSGSSTGAVDTQLTTIGTNQTPAPTTPISPLMSSLSGDFQLQKFSSCDSMDSIMSKFIESYMKKNPYRGGYYGRGGVLMEGMVGAPTPMADKVAVPTAAPTVTNAVSTTDTLGSFSETNVQVAGVDEPEIVKTDGNFIYYYNDKDHRVYIAQASPAKDTKIIKSIIIPENWQNTQIFVQGKKLVVLATKYRDFSLYDYAWFDWSMKTVVAVYDISDMNHLRIDRYFQVDGNLLQARKVGRYLYVLSQDSFHFPNVYYAPMMKQISGSEPIGLSNTDIVKKYNASSSLPSKLEVRRTDDKNQQNYISNGKKYAYNLTNTNTANCSDIEYVLPDDATIDKYNFTPSFTVLSMIDLEDSSLATKTKVLFGDVSEIHMGLDPVSKTSNLYITSPLYSAEPFTCPRGVYCMMPYYRSTESTLIHKMSISKLSATYLGSAIIPGTPINQYSMDEDTAGNFRMVTRSWNDEQTTNLYILDKNLKLAGKLEGIAPKENFQSSRFIGNKLYLVTFQQIDPLFVIDLSDVTKPQILGELKIPGYSTYLHPYDENHLIGIGYDTKDSGHGGVMNGGLKVDLYDISDIKNPKQQYSLTLGDNGSSSDALTNPRMFTWQADKNTLFLPATIYKSANDPQNLWRHSDAWQGTVAIKIDDKSGIQELARVSHIETGDLEAKRQADCAQYKITEKPVCKTLIGGGQYCPPVSTWVPEYCYTDSSVGEYFANQIWNWNDSFILRNLYIGNTLFTLSNTKLQAHDTSAVVITDTIPGIPTLPNTYTKIADVNWK